MSEKTPNARKEAARKYAAEHGVKYTEALRAVAEAKTVEPTGKDCSVPLVPYAPRIGPDTPMLRGYRYVDEQPIHRDVFTAGHDGAPGMEGIVGRPGCGKTMLAENAVIEDALRGRTQIVLDITGDYAHIQKNAEALGLDPKKVKVIDHSVLGPAVGLDAVALIEGRGNDRVAVEVLNFLLGAESEAQRQVFADVLGQVFTRAVRAAREAGGEVTMRGLLDYLADAAAQAADESHMADARVQALVDVLRAEIANLAAHADGRSPLAAAMFPSSTAALRLQIDRGDLLIIAPPRWGGWDVEYPTRSQRLPIAAMRLLLDFAFNALAELPKEWEKALTIDPVDIFPHPWQDNWGPSKDISNLAVRWTAMTTQGLRATVAATDLLWLGGQQSRDRVADTLAAAGVRAGERNLAWLDQARTGQFMLADHSGKVEEVAAVLPEERLALRRWPQPSLSGVRMSTVCTACGERIEGPLDAAESGAWDSPCPASETGQHVPHK